MGVKQPQINTYMLHKLFNLRLKTSTYFLYLYANASLEYIYLYTKY